MIDDLPVFWWLFKRYHQRHAYVCPFLMSLSVLAYRLRFQRAYWKPCRYLPGGEILEPARVIYGRAEILCVFPHWLIRAECNFWNSRLGLVLRSKGIG